MPERDRPVPSVPEARPEPSFKEDDPQLHHTADPTAGISPAGGVDPVDPAKLEQVWRFAAFSLLVVTALAATANHLHPPIGATFEARPISPGTDVVLREARLRQPLTATASAFGLSQISPVGPITVPGRGGELIVRLRVSPRDCEELVARFPGSCAGHPRLSPMPEQLGITAPKGVLEMRLEMTPATRARIGQNGEEGQAHEWSLTEDARTTTLTLRCLRSVPVTVTDLPFHPHPTCSPEGTFFELAFADRKAYSPTLAFGGDRSLRVFAAATHVETEVDNGALYFGDAQRRIHGIEPTPVGLEGDGPVDVRLGFPSARATSVAALASGEVAGATVGVEDSVPSLLARDSTVESIVYGAIVTLLLGALGCYGRALMANLSEKA
jgi:hypothetical protein